MLATRWLAGPLVLLAGCFAPENPPCTFRCDTLAANHQHCPESYECRLDGYCHLVGTVGSCPTASVDLASPDLVTTTPPDMRTADLATSSDLAPTLPDLAPTPPDLAPVTDLLVVEQDLADTSDLAVPPAADLAVPLDLAVPVDLATEPDLAVPDLGMPDLLAPPVAFTALAPVAAGARPRMVVTTDFNGDGRLDVAVVNETGTVGVLLGDGTGKLGAVATFAANATPWALALGDFDWDGKLDVVVANEQISKVSVLRSLGNGALDVPVATTVGGTPYNVAVADLDDDGHADIAVSDSGGAPDVRVLVGTGGGNFKAGTTLTTGVGPASWVSIGDFNGDKQMDIVATVSGPHLASVFLRNGGFGFQQPTNVDVGGGAAATVAAHLVGQAWDLVVANESRAVVSTILGNNDGTFQPRALWGTDTGPRHVAVADLNADGAPDLVVSNFAAHTVTVLLADKKGGYLAGQAFNVGNAPLALALADLDGDGKPDVIVPNYADNTITVLVNTTGK